MIKLAHYCINLHYPVLIPYYYKKNKKKNNLNLAGKRSRYITIQSLDQLVTLDLRECSTDYPINISLHVLHFDM